MTLNEFLEGLHSSDIEIQSYLTAKIMRQAKPDDVFTFITLHQIQTLWPLLKKYLGKKLEFWSWLLSMWNNHG